MKRMARKRIFYALIAVFCLLGAGTVFYAQGWRIDTSTLRISKVGAIYIRTFPKDTDLFLDGKPIDKNPGILDSGRFINGLFPKTYLLEARVNGFQAWHGNVTVEQARVNEFKYATLIPKTKTEIASGSIQSFAMIQDTPLLELTNGTLHFKNMVVPGNIFVGTLRNNNLLITYDKNQKKYIVFSPDKKTITQTLTADMLIPDNTSDTYVVSKTKRVISLIDLNGGNRPKLLMTLSTSSEINMIVPSESFIAINTFDRGANKSTLWLYNKIEATTEQKTVLSGKTIALVWGNNGNTLGILQDTGDVLRYEINTNTLAPTASDGKAIAFSQNGSFAVLGNTSLELFLPQGSVKTYLRFALPTINEATNIAWYGDNQHLFVQYQNRTLFLDIEDALLERFETIIQTSKSYYEENSNTFFFLEQNSLFSLPFPR